jgi:hypothetical protein
MAYIQLMSLREILKVRSCQMSWDPKVMKGTTLQSGGKDISPASFEETNAKNARAYNCCHFSSLKIPGTFVYMFSFFSFFSIHL